MLSTAVRTAHSARCPPCHVNIEHRLEQGLHDRIALVASISVRAQQDTLRWQRTRAAGEDAGEMQVLTVPREWTKPEAAKKEAAWLQSSLEEWLDAEYCPEPANKEISMRCARAFERCLNEQQVEVSDILMSMVSDLETFSFKDSFHGAFSAANGAVAIITQRILQT